MKYWKKAMLALVAVALILGAGAQVVQAGDSTDTITITVSVTHVGVAVTSTTFDFATQAIGQTAYALGINVTNTGSATETYGLRASNSSGSTGQNVWTLDTGPGVDTFGLHAIFVTQDGAFTSANNNLINNTLTGDAVTSTNRFCTSDGVFAAFSGSEDGASVASAAVRDMTLQFFTPTAVTSNQGTQTIYITVVAGP